MIGPVTELKLVSLSSQSGLLAIGNSNDRLSTTIYLSGCFYNHFCKLKITHHLLPSNLRACFTNWYKTWIFGKNNRFIETWLIGKYWFAVWLAIGSLEWRLYVQAWLVASIHCIEKGDLCAVSICCHLNQRRHNEEKAACMMETKATERAASACKISD